MKRFLIAPLLTLLMVLAVVGGVMFLRPEPVQANTETVTLALVPCKDVVAGLPVGQLCAEQVGKNVLVKLDGQTILSVPLSNVQLPPVTVNVPRTIRVTLPRVTVTGAPVTVTLPGVTLPGSTVPGRTVTIQLPQSTRTVIMSGQTRIVTATPGVKTVVTPAAGGPPVAIITVKGANGQTIQTSVTITASPETGAVTTKPVVKEREVRVSVPRAIAYGIGVLLLGLVLGLLAIYLAYGAGYKNSEQSEAELWHKFRSDVFGKKEKGEHE